MAFALRNVNDNFSLFSAFFGTYDTTTAVKTIPIYGPEQGDQSYVFLILDLGEDGICCGYGNGKYELYLGDAMGELLTSGGDFGGGESFYFNVAGLDAAEYGQSPTLSPTLSSSLSPTLSPTLSPANFTTSKAASTFVTLSSPTSASPAVSRAPTSYSKDDKSNNKGKGKNDMKGTTAAPSSVQAASNADPNVRTSNANITTTSGVSSRFGGGEIWYGQWCHYFGFAILSALPFFL